MQELKIRKITPIFPNTNPINKILIRSNTENPIFCVNFNLNGKKKHIGIKYENTLSIYGNS